MHIDTITSKGTGKQNEDAFVCNNPTFAVFDGATSLDAFLDSEGRSGGRIAAELFANAFREHVEDITSQLSSANAELNRCMQELGKDVNNVSQRFRSTAAIVQLQKEYIEWITIGDSGVLCIYKDGKFRIFQDIFPHTPHLLELWIEASKHTETWRETLAAIRPEIQKNRNNANITYGVLDGNPKYEKFVRHGRINREEVSSILLFTDGFAPPSKQSETNFQPFIDIVKDRGLHAALDYIRDLEHSDPNCITFPRFKPHDDATAIYLTL